jgi:hypothetical protein
MAGIEAALLAVLYLSAMCGFGIAALNVEAKAAVSRQNVQSGGVEYRVDLHVLVVLIVVPRNLWRRTVWWWMNTADTSRTMVRVVAVLLTTLDPLSEVVPDVELGDIETLTAGFRQYASVYQIPGRTHT